MSLLAQTAASNFDIVRQPKPGDELPIVVAVCRNTGHQLVLDIWPEYTLCAASVVVSTADVPGEDGDALARELGLPFIATAISVMALLPWPENQDPATE